MTRDETVALFLQGREAWNAWAEEMLAKRKALEDAGKWGAEKGVWRDDLIPKNDDTRAWKRTAAADFSHCRFLLKDGEGKIAAPPTLQQRSETSRPTVKAITPDGDMASFNGFNFPSDASFDDAIFLGDVSFDRAVFSGAVWFNRTTFLGYASFASASFLGCALFDKAAFSGDISFDGATFSGRAMLSRVTFSDTAFFVNTVFLGDALFEDAVFIENVFFANADFSGTASFRNATFQKAAIFRAMEFREEADFTGVKAGRAFDMTGAVFTCAPAFNLTDFNQAPDLDDLRFPLPGFWSGGKGLATDIWTGPVAKYRALRRMAIAGADYEREQMAFKGELRARRWTVDKPWHLGLWLGLIYDGVADCGRSIVRPLNVWLASVFAFAAIYLWAGAGGLGACAAGDGIPAVKALYLSGRNALVLFSGARDSRVGQAYQCLYGGTPAEPAIPDAVSFIESFVQLPVSALLIFLLLLAVRNRYKIK